MATETYESETGPRCPYCEHTHQADEAFYYNERNDTLYCDKCGRASKMEVHHSTSWTCTAIDDVEVS